VVQKKGESNRGTLPALYSAFYISTNIRICFNKMLNSEHSIMYVLGTMTLKLLMLREYRSNRLDI
jgi:hypothetical protein